MNSKYGDLGVDVHKRGIESFQESITNLFPNAFCVVNRDPKFPDLGLVLHTDGAGSKPIQAYLHWREYKAGAVFEGLARDVLAMNLDDVICIGATPSCFVDYIALNSFKVNREVVLKSLSQGFKRTIEKLKSLGVYIMFSGGETADLPDQIRTLDVSGTIFGYVKLSDVITGANIKPKDRIVGLRSGGKCRYEDGVNSGIMCNGITLARHCLLKKEYSLSYPEIVEPDLKGYYGRFGIDDYVEDLDMSIGEAILSPTRIYAPIIRTLMEEYGVSIKGMVHNTGGGQTKCLRIGKNIHFIKDSLPEPDPIFKLIKEESKENWRNMYQVFNMGVGFELIVDAEVADDIIDHIEKKYGVEAMVIGYCEDSYEGNRLTIKSPYGKFMYIQ